MGVWAQVKKMAADTPEERNRYVDFLRAVSILVVVTGHWLVAAVYYHDGTLETGKLLVLQPETQWLTWLFQVMPIFFIVGGYANGVSLESARRKNIDYAGWLSSRLYRLVTPLLVLLFGWAILAATMYFLGVDGDTTRRASRGALIPTWFLAIYILVVMLAPVMYKFWRRWGFVSILALASTGALVDVLFFAADIKWIGITNYFWVWLSVHQLGYAWRDGRLGSPGRLLLYSAIALGVLWLLIFKGPYPFAMVGSPDEGLSNTLPPKITLLALGIFQFGLLLAIEAPMRRFLSSVRVWAATVLINSMIMTLYLWHITVSIIVISVAVMAGGIGLGLEPGSQEWWLARPAFIGVLYAILLPITFLLAPFERRPRPKDAPVPAAGRQITGAIMICFGVAYLALMGFGKAPVLGLDVGAFLMVVVGSSVSGLLHGFR